jgi:hypothetical protein
MDMIRDITREAPGFGASALKKPVVTLGILSIS